MTSLWHLGRARREFRSGTTSRTRELGKHAQRWEHRHKPVRVASTGYKAFRARVRRGAPPLRQCRGEVLADTSVPVRTLGSAGRAPGTIQHRGCTPSSVEERGSSGVAARQERAPPSFLALPKCRRVGCHRRGLGATTGRPWHVLTTGTAAIPTMYFSLLDLVVSSSSSSSLCLCLVTL